MCPERRISPAYVALLGSLLLLVAAIAVPAAAAPTPADSTAYSQSDAAEPDDGNLTAETILEGYREQMDSLETLTVDIQSNATSESYSSASEQTIWVDFENERIRTELDSEYGETITVRNETGTVVYNVDENTVSSYNYTFDDRYGDQFGIGTLTNDSEVTYAGTETIDGTETYRLDIEPETQYSTGNYNLTLWMDAETYLPVQYEMRSDSERYSYELTQRYTNVTVNETIPDERFTIDIPDDAEQPDYSTPEFYSYEDESELRSNTSQSVPDPTIPENYTFESGYVTEGDDYESVTLTYTTDSDESLTVSKRGSSGYDYSDHDQFEEVAVGNQTGYYNEFDYGESNISILVWECGDDQYTTYGSLNESETIGVAESIDCE